MSEILFEKQERTAIIRLNRPEVHNAINQSMMDRLEEILDELEQTPEVIAVILTGSGERSFCSGGDLKYFATLQSREAARAMSLRMRAILDRLYLGDRVVIAAVNGLAYGGGGEILTACHIRLAVPEATFSFRQAANGVITGWGGGIRLMNLLGAHRALPLLLTSRVYTAEQMREMGFVEEIIPREDLLPRALELAEVIAANSPAAVRGYLNLFRQVIGNVPDSLKNAETEIFADLWMGNDFRSWLNQFLNRK
jgi:enoyl-CoA hydratase/carnithine racemase